MEKKPSFRSSWCLEYPESLQQGTTSLTLGLAPSALFNPCNSQPIGPRTRNRAQSVINTSAKQYAVQRCWVFIPPSSLDSTQLNVSNTTVARKVLIAYPSCSGRSPRSGFARDFLLLPYYEIRASPPKNSCGCGLSYIWESKTTVWRKIC